jgi:tetrahydromethanopterin S-methyltransferase subunit D
MIQQMAMRGPKAGIVLLAARNFTPGGGAVAAFHSQCDIRTGTVMCWRSSRLTPPINASRSGEW